MKLLCHSLSSISKKDKKARFLSILLQNRTSMQRAFYQWVCLPAKGMQPYEFRAHSKGLVPGRVRSKTTLNMAAIVQQSHERIAAKNPGSISMNASGSGVYYGNQPGNTI